MKRRWRWTLGTIAVLAASIAVVAVVALSRPPFGGAVDGQRLERARTNPMFRNGRFANDPPPPERKLAETIGMLQEQFGGDQVRVPPGPIPVVPVTPASIATAPPAPSLRAFWIGHASVYVELDGVRLLVDPVFSDYASPFNVGPKRFHPPPIPLADLPPIDAVLITHDHYDHLDMRTVMQLGSRGTTFFVPLGVGAHLERWGVPSTQIRELEWWQEGEIRGVRIVSTPTRHYSGRRLDDRNATLWSSWSVLGATQRFFVSGDTGYGDHFRAIGERFGPFDLAFIKIGAYGPSAAWADIHMSAEDAVRAHVDVRGRRMFPVHWSTFNLAFHDWDEPIRHTLAEAAKRKVEVLTPPIGEIVDAAKPFASEHWWEQVRASPSR